VSAEGRPPRGPGPGGLGRLWRRRAEGQSSQHVGLTREQSLQARPVRNPAVVTEATAGGARLTVPVVPGRWVSLLLRILKFGARPNFRPTRTIELDRVGAFVWELCDGSRTVKELASALAAHEKLPRREAEHSLALFLKMLAERRLLLLQLPVDTPSGNARASGQSS